ncbi:MAG: gfo/Idh/MocA family oxidoreductase [Bacteroidetes bacterium]|nr:MAG: gfo/Idh/MocA family oxidoreductase [Bacteroidota bacterium]
MMNRRSFVKTVSGGLAGASLAGLAPLGTARAVPPSDQIRVGVIGVGSRGKWVMRHMLRVPGVRIGALCDVYEPRFAEGREITGEATPVYTDYRAMLDAEARNLDAVLVASPLYVHDEHVIASLDSGLHVYGEKSMAYSLEGCNAILRAVERSGRRFQIGHQYRYAPWTQEAIRRIRAGEIGEVTHVFGYWHRNNNWRRPVPDPNDPALERLINWRMYLDYSRGLLAELGSHHIDIANWAFNELPVAALGTGSLLYYDDGREVYDNVQVTFEYPSGRRMLFSSLLGNHHAGYQIWIYGTGGSIQITLQDATLYQEPWRENSAVPADLPREGVTTTATLGAQGDMPYRGPGYRLEVEDRSADEVAIEAFFTALRNDERPVADERVGWGSAIPVAFGHQAIRAHTRIDFGEHVRAANLEAIYGDA